ncbi:MAG: RNA polymerase sigma factor, partial [Flavobacteriales bacterium]|nr:RNA polymerase sigma factor [Flavobacteriales bacterium]
MSRKNVSIENRRFIEPRKLDIENAKEGDQNAMFNLYKYYSVAMLNTSFRILNNKEDAEDVLQEAFIKAFSRLNQYNYQSTFGAWFKRIVVNQSIDQLKKKKDLVFNDAETIKDVAIVLDTENNLQEKLDSLYKALHQLPDGYRAVLSLYMLEGYDHDEISEILNIGVSTS